jgi:hypothetical protein
MHQPSVKSSNAGLIKANCRKNGSRNSVMRRYLSSHSKVFPKANDAQFTEHRRQGVEFIAKSMALKTANGSLVLERQVLREVLGDRTGKKH